MGRVGFFWLRNTNRICNLVASLWTLSGCPNSSRIRDLVALSVVPARHGQQSESMQTMKIRKKISKSYAKAVP